MRPRRKPCTYNRRGGDTPNFLLLPRLSEWATLFSVPFSKSQKGLFEGILSKLGSFSNKMRTSLKMLLLIYVLEHSNFPAISLLESCSQTDYLHMNCLHPCISIICEYAPIPFWFPSRRPSFAVRPSKGYFSGWQFQNRTYSKDLKTCKSFKLDFTFYSISFNKGIMLASP